MRQISLSVVLCAIVVVTVPLAALAGSYTVRHEDGRIFETRFPPRFSDHDVQFLTRTGDWVTLSKQAVVEVTNGSTYGNHVTMLDSKTVLIGWAPNDAPAPRSPRSAGAQASSSSQTVDPVALVLGYIALRGPRPVPTFTVDQFVDTEDVAGAIPIEGTFLFKEPEPETLEALFGLSQRELLMIQGVSGGEQLRQEVRQHLIQGVPFPSGFETIQGLPPGGFQSVQGIGIGTRGQASPAAASPVSGGSSPN